MDLRWLILIIPSGYYLLSLLFLLFPSLLHKKQRYKYPPFNDLIDTDSIFCIGHRGGGWEGVENTLELFIKNNLKIHMFQLDVNLTKDNKLVVHHDGNLMRTCGDNRLISECNYNELPCFLAKYQSFGGPMIETSHNKIALLEEIFQKFPEKPMNIQLKSACEQGVKQFNRLVKKYDRENITIWGAVGSYNAMLRECNPNIVNFYSAGEVLKIFVLFIFGLLPFVCLRHGVLDIPLLTENFIKIIQDFTDSCWKKCLAYMLIGMLKCFNGLSGLFIRHLKKRGILTFYFIINDEDDFQRALDKGCSGIMTDLTGKLQTYLKKKNVFYPQHKVGKFQQ